MDFKQRVKKYTFDDKVVYSADLFSEWKDEYGSLHAQYYASCHGETKEEVVQELAFKKALYMQAFDEIMRTVKDFGED